GVKFNDVYVYEQEVFDNCYSLTNIKINNDNKYYLGDSNGILFNKDKTTLLVYPQGVSRSSYTIPSTVTMVALEAFENNTHLSRLIVPDGVTDIGAKAFNGCTNLQWIYFRSLNSPTIGEQTFNSTGALTNGFVVYCIPQPSVWYKDNEQMWRQFNVEKYNAIQEVPNESITTDMLYTLFVSDSDGNGLAGHVVTVSYKNNKQKTTVTDGDGYAIFSVPTGEALFDGNAINLSIVDPTEEYYDYNMNNFVLDLKTTFSFVTMISKPTVKGTRFIEHGEQDEHEMIFRDREISSNIIYVNKAALTYSAKTDQGEYAPKKVYEDGKWRYNYISTLCIQARVVWDQLSSPQKIEIVQSGHVVATYSFTDSSKNVSTKKYASYESSFVMDDQTNTKHESGTVIFELHPDLFEDNHEATIEIILYVESNGEIHPHKEDLNIRVFDFSLPFELNEYFSADGFSFKLDDSIPIIGNSSLNLEMDGMDEAMPPIWMYYKADKIVVTFNLDKIANLNLPDIETGKDTHYDSSSKSMREGSYSTMEETKSAIKDAIKDKKKLLETSKSHDFQLSLFGAIEISPITSNGEQFQVTNGSVSGILSYKFHISRTFVVIHIPVILQFEFSANGQFTFTLFNEESVSEGESVFADNPLEINVVFDVTIRGGVGCSIASVGVYGSIGLDLLLQFGVGSFIDKALFNINLGVYVQAKLGFIKVDGKINLYNKTIPIYVDEDLQHKQLKYKRVNSLGEVEEYNTIEGVINAEIIENDGSWQISNSNYNLYPINSKVVEYKGKLYKFYIDDVYANPVFDNESLYNDLNYLKLVYCEQIKDENGNNIWSDPKIVNLNSINNELEFDVIVDEFGIHIVYTRVKDVITIEGDLNTENVLSNLEVCLLTLNESNKYNSNPSIISGNSDNYMYSPQVYSINKHINVTWVENSEHSIYGVGSSMKDDGSEQLVHTTANSLVVYDAYQELHVYDNLGPVISKDMCLFNNELVVLMITEDERTIKTDDGNEYTEKYLKSSIIDINSGKTSYIENYIINEELIESISLYDVFNVGGKYYVYDNSNIYEVTYDKTNKALYLELLVDNIGNSFEIVINDNEIKGILYIENEPGEKENTGSSNLYYRSYNDGTFGNPIKLTNLKANQYEMVTNKYYDEYVHGFNYYIIDGDVYFDYQYYQTYAEINTIEYEDGTIEHDVQNKISSYYVSDITKLAKDNDVVLENVIFDIDSVRKGNEFKLSVDVYNDSLEEITEITVNIHYNNEVIKTCVINETILPGENKTIDVIIKLDTIGEYYDFSISTNLEEEVQYLDNNRLNKIKVGYADLMMNVKYLTMGNIEYIFVMLQNIGSYQSESGKLYVSSSTVSPFKNYNVAVDTIYELEYGSLMPLEYKYYTIEINSVYFTDSIVTVFAKGETQDEYNYDNNISYVTINPTNTSEGYGYYSIKYMLDGESYKTISYELGDKINELEHPVEEGYTFKGWYNLPTKMPAYDVEVFGFFEKNTYSVTYKVDNINEYTDLYFYQDYVQIRNAEIKVGHTFSGWYTEDGDHVTETFEMPASDIILYGSFVKNSYNIEYYVNEEYYDVQSFEYGTDITEDMLLKYTKPIPEGHSISNWTNYPNKIEDRNYKVYATLTPNTYKVTYTIPGKNDLELVLPYGSIIDLNYEE
ncbi:MAG: leucine-rich repeat protein, partial [Bacilli bacterium]|nr:leucine-rich repeat protein [Bacilli bacterium]